MNLARAGRAVFALVAATLLVSMAVKAALDVSWPWDVWYYHLPFAGRVWGILPASAYVLTPLDQARYEGYPLLAEALQGFAWKVAGRPEAANFVAFAALLSLVAYARVRLGVPWWLATLALLAIPLVQIHATACYIDLPANAALAVVVLEAIRVAATGEPPSPRALGLIVVAAVLAGNMRLQLEPLLLVALLSIALALFRSRRSVRRARSLAALALSLPLVFASPLKNLVVHHNPAYPVALHVAGHELPSAEEPYDSSPPYLAATPRPWRWVLSLAEVGIQPLAESRRWTIDQYMPPDSRGNRMGGFFGAYVALNLVALALFAWRGARPGRAAAGGVLVLSVACSLMPQSHELRYYLVWMIVLVLTNAGLLVRAGALCLELGAALLVTTCLAVVLASTRGWHVLPQRYPFEALVRDHVDPALLEGVPDGGSICVARPPWTALYAAPFHPPRSYVVREAESDAECPSADGPRGSSETARSMATVRTSSDSLARSAQR